MKQDDPLAPARGLVYGLAFGLILWLLMILGVSKAIGSGCDVSRAIQSVRDDIPKERVRGLSNTICRQSQRHGLSAELIVAIITTETHFRNIRGRTGEAGYMQIKPATFKRACGYTTTLDRLIYDWEENIRCGVAHLANLRDSQGLLNAIGSYNSGPKYGHRNLDYVGKVLENLKRIKGGK